MTRRSPKRPGLTKSPPKRTASLIRAPHRPAFRPLEPPDPLEPAPTHQSTTFRCSSALRDTPPYRHLGALITLGFLRELRMREPAITVRDLARSTGISGNRLRELEQCTGKPLTAKESEAIRSSLYWRAGEPTP